MPLNPWRLSGMRWPFAWVLRRSCVPVGSRRGGRRSAQGRPLVLTASVRDRLAGVLVLRRRAGALVSATNAHTPAFGVVAEDETAARVLVGAAMARAPRMLALDYLDAAAVEVRSCP